MLSKDLNALNVSNVQYVDGSLPADESALVFGGKEDIGGGGGGAFTSSSPPSLSTHLFSFSSNTS